MSFPFVVCRTSYWPRSTGIFFRRATTLRNNAGSILIHAYFFRGVRLLLPGNRIADSIAKPRSRGISAQTSSSMYDVLSSVLHHRKKSDVVTCLTVLHCTSEWKPPATMNNYYMLVIVGELLCGAASIYFDLRRRHMSRLHPVKTLPLVYLDILSTALVLASVPWGVRKNIFFFFFFIVLVWCVLVY